MNITKTVLQIELRSVRAAIHHLQSIDLGELDAGAKVFGTPEDQHLIAAVRACLAGLPPIHP
jgi:hypothetical protein